MAYPSWEHRRCSEDREALRRENSQLRADIAALVAFVEATDVIVTDPLERPEPVDGIDHWLRWDDARAAVEPVLARWREQAGA